MPFSAPFSAGRQGYTGACGRGRWDSTPLPARGGRARPRSRQGPAAPGSYNCGQATLLQAPRRRAASITQPRLERHNAAISLDACSCPLCMLACHSMPPPPHHDIDLVLGHGMIESATLASDLAGLVCGTQLRGRTPRQLGCSPCVPVSLSHSNAPYPTSFGRASDVVVA